jgi:hypothetical protein
MGNGRRFLSATLIVAGAGTVVWFWWELAQPREPVYRGEPLSYWLGGLDVGSYNSPGSPGPNLAADAIRHIGTNAVPILLRMVQEPNSDLMDRAFDLFSRHRLIKTQHVYANRNFKALSAFKILGPAAKDAVPRLIKIFSADPDPFPQQAIPLIFAGIGRDAEPAIPILVQHGLTHTNVVVRNNSIHALDEIHLGPELVVPALTKCLADPDAIVRAKAASALGRFGTDAQSAVPALLALWSKETALNGGTGGSRKIIGTKVFTSVGIIWTPPSRIAFTPDVAGEAREAIKQIDPRAADEAGVK